MTLATTVTIPELAKARGLEPGTLRRQLLKLHAKRGGWLYREGARTYRVNLSQLLAAHPALRQASEVQDRVRSLEERADSSDDAHDAQARAHRAHGARISALEKRMSRNGP